MLSTEPKAEAVNTYRDLDYSGISFKLNNLNIGLVQFAYAGRVLLDYQARKR